MNEGKVVVYAADMELGIIKSRDGGKYVFSKSDWLSYEITPEAGLIVTFEVAGDNTALKISVMADSPDVG